MGFITNSRQPESQFNVPLWVLHVCHCPQHVQTYCSEGEREQGVPRDVRQVLDDVVRHTPYCIRAPIDFVYHSCEEGKHGHEVQAIDDILHAPCCQVTGDKNLDGQGDYRLPEDGEGRPQEEGHRAAPSGEPRALLHEQDHTEAK
eukprot:1161585-Rhodomonas_salina.1